jgi:endonuclease V-like protein UPF0215 family
MRPTKNSMLGLEPNCRYYVVTDVRTQQVVAVVEAVREPEARQFFAALRHLLQAAPESTVRVLESAMPPNEVPVFRRHYLKAMQANAKDEARVSGATRH